MLARSLMDGDDDEGAGITGFREASREFTHVKDSIGAAVLCCLECVVSCRACLHRRPAPVLVLGMWVGDG